MKHTKTKNYDDRDDGRDGDVDDDGNELSHEKEKVQLIRE